MRDASKKICSPQISYLVANEFFEFHCRKLIVTMAEPALNVISPPESTITDASELDKDPEHHNFICISKCIFMTIFIACK